jgi:hypothetical protein
VGGKCEEEQDADDEEGTRERSPAAIRGASRGHRSTGPLDVRKRVLPDQPLEETAILRLRRERGDP